MFATLLTFATEAVEDDTSMTLFYVVGGIAAAWAIILFAVGMRSATFPASAGAQRGVIAVSFLVTIGAMVSAVVTS